MTVQKLESVLADSNLYKPRRKPKYNVSQLKGKRSPVMWDSYHRWGEALSADTKSWREGVKKAVKKSWFFRKIIVAFCPKI